MKRILLVALFLVLIVGCGEPKPDVPPPDRESLIPADQKITPETDVYPLTSETDEYEDPVPMPYPVNTAGAEDSAFMMPDGNTMYVWFTPLTNFDLQSQLVDGVTGIYVSHKVNGAWSKPERVMLQDKGKLALDGCEFVQGNKMLFCTAREGYTGLHWFSAEYINGKWQNWEKVNFDPDYEVGELHIVGDELYFHSARAGGKGEYDIWVSKMVNGEWAEPENIEAVNSEHTDGWPFVTQDGSELWFTRAYGAPELYRSKKVNGEWQEPEKMFSAFSGESSMDNEGNVYFTHHYYKDDVMLEADIYVAYKK